MKRSLLSTIVVVGIMFTGALASAEIKIGVLAKRGPDVVQQRWSGLADYLTHQLGEKVTFVPLPFTQIRKFCSLKKGQFLFANPWWYVRAKVNYRANALVTVQNQGSGTMFGGVIFAKKISGINKVEQVRGKTVMCPKFSSAGGWIFQKAVLVRNNIRPEQDCKALLEGGTHDDVVYAVRDGKADVGMVRTNILERMNNEGKINMDDYVIINQVSHHQFPEVISTDLYPTWPVAALSGTSADLAERMKQALLTVPAGHPALNSCKVERFVDALDYNGVEEALSFLQVPPFQRNLARNTAGDEKFTPSREVKTASH
jgi:phosphate/phosphite/phosphonate ABC transporter binding protein